MKRFASSVLFLAATSAVTLAQENTPRAEVGMNFSYVLQNPGGGASNFNSFGGSGVAVYNLNRVLGVVADLGAYNNPNSANFNPTTFTYLFGPRFNMRKSSRFTPYAQALFGGARVSSSFTDVNGNMFTGVTNGFAAAYGGGLDVRLNDRVALKPFQVEYLQTRLPNVWSANNWQDNMRLSAGIVFRFGSK